MVPMSRLLPSRLPVKPASTGIIIVWQDMKQKHAASTNTASLEKTPFSMSEFSEKKFKQLLTRREIKKFKKLFKQFLNDSPQNYPPPCHLLTKIFRVRILWATPRFNFNILLCVDIQ